MVVLKCFSVAFKIGSSMFSLQWHLKYLCQLFAKIQSFTRESSKRSVIIKTVTGGGGLPEEVNAIYIQYLMNS